MHIRIIGCGNMGSAFCLPLARTNTLSYYDKMTEKAEELSKKHGGLVVDNPTRDLEKVDLFLLAVKPQDLESIAPKLKALMPHQILASVIAGIPLDKYKSLFPNTPILRMMPNLAIRYGKGIVALVEDPKIIPFKEKIQSLFSPLGTLHWIQEKSIDAMTSLFGSGIAFVATAIEAMADSGIAMGIPAQDAYLLTRKMVEGTLACLDASPNVPAAFKWEVTSPGGTTIAGLRAFEKAGIRSGLIETFLAAYNRSIELKEEN